MKCIHRPRAAVALVLVCALSSGCIHAETTRDPQPVSAATSTLDVRALARAARRNLIIGEIVMAGGGALGLSSGALMLAAHVRDCPVDRPSCNDALGTANMALGASSLFVVAVGAVFVGIGYAQRRIVTKLRGERPGP